MIDKLLKSVFGTKQDRDVKALAAIVNKINQLEDQISKLSDDQLKAQTPKFKELLSKGKSLDDILPEAFATVREASKRVLGMRHFDVQLMGGMVLHQGKISEMKTGEGKTLTATLPLYLNALTGKGAHLVTVNDYLAKRDATEMGQLYNWLGLTTGVIVHDLDDETRKEQYNCDITYGTNNEFAFDYLRDNMKFDLNDYVQRDHHFCIVDEVDSILIDEARTPLLISGPSEGNTELYLIVDKIIPKLKAEEHYKVDEKSRTSVLTDEGITQVQKYLNIKNLFDVQNIELLHHVNQALKAHTLFIKDVDYVIKEEKVIIVDEFTGRLKHGSRWSDGLHQAVEAKEGVPIKSENQTLASITFQNFFKLYERLSGMTGTADTEAEEFRKIYNLDVVVIPTNRPMIREDDPDAFYATRKGKFIAVAKLIQELNKKGQPVLVGTISIESSELISQFLRQQNIPHEVLNAKNHEREAQIISNAGAANSVTIATNMAGRGTDIKLTEETKKLGGLYIIGTERHESRRIDNQLRGRSGRQGDPGHSKFFLSLEDDLMRIFGSEGQKKMMARLMSDDEPVEHKMVTRFIANAQKKVESHNFDIRKHLLDFDNVMNEQRKVIYRLRRDILNDENNIELIHEMIEDVSHSLAENFTSEKNMSLSDYPWDQINQGLQNLFNTAVSINPNECASKYAGDIGNYINATAKDLLQQKFAPYPEEQIKLTVREVLLATFDHHWKDHLLAMDHLKEGINLRAYGQKDPLIEYKREAYLIYEEMKKEIRRAVVEKIFSIRLYTPEEIEAIKKQQQALLEAQLEAHRKMMEAEANQSNSANNNSNSPQSPSGQSPLPQRQTLKVGRNDLCPCGSGKKFKHCHGK